MCNCNSTTTLCSPSTECSCPVKDLSTDCVVYTGNNLSCSGILQGTILTELIEQLDTYICEAITQATGAISLISVGTGFPIYKGIDSLGRKEIKTIKSIDDLLVFANSTDQKEVTLEVDREKLTDFIIDAVPTSVPNLQDVTDGTGNNVTTNDITVGSLLSLGNANIPAIEFNDGSNFNNSRGTLDTSLSITTPRNWILPDKDGTIALSNLQKTITGSTYTLTDSDDEYTIIINNASTAITITVPTGLKNAFNVGFIQRGTADVTFVGSGGMVINTPVAGAYKIKGQNYNAHIEQYGVLSECFLLGNLKI